MAIFNKKNQQKEYVHTYFETKKNETVVVPLSQRNDVEPKKQDKKSFGLFSSKELKQELENKATEIEKLKFQNSNLEDLLTPEMKDTISLRNHIKQLTDTINLSETKLKTTNENIKENEDTIALQNKNIIANNDIIELESFALYKPTYNFANVDEYKEKLANVRQYQKDMIKNKTATYGAESWIVNNSPTKGKKLVADMEKLCLRSFNNECDAAVENVRFNNFDRCEQRIDKSATSIEKLGQMMSVGITLGYISLKKQELHIALEYQMKKQEEKEHLREIRAQQREDARVAREIEEERKKAIKEQTHYENAFNQIKDQIDSCQDEKQKDSLIEKLNDIEQHLISITDNIKKLDYREANQRAGYVYIISNIGAFGKDVYKIGMTRRLEPTDRVDELGDASVPYNFDIHAMIFSDDAPALETALHRAFEDRKLNMVNTRREFFNVTLNEIKEVVKKTHDKNVEFIDVPPAYQYRESIKIKELINK